MRTAALILIGLLSATQPSLSAGLPDVSTEALIDQLTGVEAETPGIDATASYSTFIAEDAVPKFQVGIIGSPPPAVPPAMRELVRRGLRALPALLHHLDDARPTHLQIGTTEKTFFGGQQYNEEYDAGPQGFLCVSDSCDKTAKWFDGPYTVKVGDVCFVLVGQIVNRRLQAVRYQPTAILIVNSPVQSAALAGKTRKDWEGLTEEGFRASLISDLHRAPNEDESNAALLRLMFYGVADKWAKLGPPLDPDEWKPDGGIIARVDALALRYDLPKEFGQIGDYARYYWGTVERGRKVIQGSLVTPQVRKNDAGRVHIVSSASAPAFSDGGCMFVSLTYDPETDKMVHIECNYELQAPPRLQKSP